MLVSGAKFNLVGAKSVLLSDSSDSRHVLTAQRCYVLWRSVVVGCLITGAKSAEFSLAPSVDLTLIYHQHLATQKIVSTKILTYH
jgi:hypothetical protein